VIRWEGTTRTEDFVVRDAMAGAGAGSARVAAAAAAADGAFAADLYRVLGPAADNTVFSPVSIAAALRLALIGARGETAAQIAAALHLTGPEAAADGLRLLSAAVAQAGDDTGDTSHGGDDGAVTFRAPNTMWVQAGLPLEPSFTTQIQDAAAVTVRQADFRAEPEAARTEINRLIAEQTADKITGLLGPGTVSPLTRLVLASAVYLKAAWATPFPGSATRDAPFHPDGDGGGPALTVRMMRLTASLPYVRGPGYQAVVLPYQAGRLAMAVVLPDGPLSALTPRLAGRGVGGLLQEAARQRVALALPKFRQRASFGLVPALRQLGIEAAFTDRADFSGITPAEPLSISAVVHQAYIDVDEQGTEAAAATAITMRPMAAIRQPEPVTMTVDRPFLFAIVDPASGLPLFLGQVVRPAPG
jgi:serine protease inhibitor